MVSFVLAAGALLFSKLTTDLVITPIENMIKKIQAITSDPLKAAQDEEEKLLLEELAEQEAFADAQAAAESKVIKIGKDGEKEKDAPMETVVLE